MIKEVELGSVCYFENGDRGKNYPSQAAFVDKGIPFISAKNLEGNLIKKEKLNYISEETYNKLGGGKLQLNDILFCLRGSLGKFAINNNGIKGAIASSLVLLRAKEGLQINYLKHYLKSPRVERLVSKSDNGSSQPNLSGANVKKFPIPLPPLEDQKKIAGILDAADTYKQKTKALIKKYDELTQSLFLDMFGDPVTNPKGWEKVNLGEFIKNLNTGVSVNSTDKDYSDDKIGVLKTSCVYSGIFRPNEAKVIRDDEYKRMKLNPTADSIIISRMNTSELVGKSAYISNNFVNLYLPDRLWQTEKNTIEHNVRWLSNALSFQSFMNEISKISSGTSGSMKNISKKKFLKLLMIYPPFKLQNQFAERVKVIEEQKANAQASLQKADSLFNSLMQKAFKGELTNPS